MGLDQEAIKKRFSQIELDISNMNRMIDDNLQINEVGNPIDKSEETETETPDTVLSPKKLSEMTAEAADTFVKKAEQELSSRKEEQDENIDYGDEKLEEKALVGGTAKEPLQNNEEVESVANSTIGVKLEETKVVERVVEMVTASAVLPVESQTDTRKKDVDTSEHAIDQTTDTSEDFTAGNVTTAISSNSSFSSPVEPVTPIFLPKNNSEAKESKEADQSKTALRRPTNPFRVVSVGTAHSESKSAREKTNDPKTTEVDGAMKFQKRLDYLTKKCLKLQKEINYLNDMNYQNNLSIEDGRKLSNAIEKLQEYLDSKTKEKYDLGVLLSRQLRKEIDRGENGQFWIGTK